MGRKCMDRRNGSLDPRRLAAATRRMGRFGHYRAAQRPVQGRNQLVGRFRRDELALRRRRQAARGHLGDLGQIRVGLRAPTEKFAARPEADDVNGQREPVSFEFSCERAGIAAAGFIAVGYKHDRAGLFAKVERVGSILDRRREGRVAVGHNSFQFGHDGPRCSKRGFNFEFNVAAGVFWARTVRDEANATIGRHLRNDAAHRLHRLHDPRHL